MELAEDAVAAERFQLGSQPRLVVGGAEVEQVATMLRDLGQRRPRLAFGLVGVGESHKTAEVGVAAKVAGDEDQLFAIDLERGADDRLDAELATGLEVADGAVDSAAVRDRERGHLQLRRPHHQLVGMRPAVEEGEV
jgi:hypothetical protein